MKITKSQVLYGIGAAALAVWWTRRQQQRGAHRRSRASGRGEVIFSNTPHPSEV